MKLLYDLAEAVQYKSFFPDLEQRKVGKVHQARWHNKCSAILRKYVSDPSPSQKLKRLCTIILNWYVPFIIRVKSNWKIQHGAGNFFWGIQLAKQCLQGKEITLSL